VTRQGSPADFDNYPLLCEAIRTAFNEAGHSDWLITVATTINPINLAKGYNMTAMSPHIDWFNVMSYDIHGVWDSAAGANADMEYIQNTMNYIFGIGVPREKIVFGMAAYGRSMRLTDPTCTSDGCPVSGAGLWGCHGEAGNLPYFQIDETYIQTGNYDSLVLNSRTGSMELITSVEGDQQFTSFDS
jgi:chitinase